MSGSFGGIMSIALSALRTQQLAIEVASQNIANAQTPGYTRTRAVIDPLPPRITPSGVLGTGVMVTDVARVRDLLLDQAYRRESATAANADARWSVLNRIEELFAEPSEAGLSAALDRFSDAWSDLANNPVSRTARQVVVQRGQAVANWLNGADARLSLFQTETYTRLVEQGERVNTLLAQIASLNKQIIPIEAAGATASPLRDQRDIAVDELASLIGATALENEDGSINVIVAGQTMVDQGTSKRLDPPTIIGGQVRYTMSGSPEALIIRTGSVAGLLETYNGVIPRVRSQLDQVATGLVHTVNRLHRTGYTPAGDALNLAGEAYDPATPAALRGSRVDFFASPPGTAPGVTPTVLAREIRINDAVLANLDLVAAGRAGWNGTGPVNQPGDNAIAIAIADLRTGTTMLDDTSLTDPPGSVGIAGLGGRSLGDFWRGIVTETALDASRAESDRTAGETLQQQMEQRRQSISGVSIDEELINLSRAQQAYQAAARVLGTVQELTADLLSIVR